MKSRNSKLNLILLFSSVLILSIILSACSLFSVKTITVNFYDGEELVRTYTVFKPENVKAPSISGRDGYEVVDWKDASGENSFSIEFDFAKTNDFYAVWSPIVYGVTYNLDGGLNSSDNPDTYTIEDSFTLEDASKEGFTFLGWTSSTEPSPKKSLSVSAGTFGELTFTANFASQDTRYLYYQTNGGREIEHSETAGLFFTSAPTPVRTGYEFAGWYSDEELLIPAVFPLAAVKTMTTVYAKWTPVTYHVYVMDGESEEPFYTINYTIESDDITLIERSLEGHTFDGYTEGNSSVLHKTFTIPSGSHKDYVLTVHYTINEYTITFDSLGGTAVQPITQEFGSRIYAPQSPTKNDCEFTGWYTDALCRDKFTFNTMPAGDITLYAGWSSERNFKLNYSATDPDAELSANRVSGAVFVAGETVELYAPVYCDGGVFVYWTSGGNVYDYSNELEFPMPTNNLSLVANYVGAQTYEYDKAIGGNLTLNANFNVNSFGGGKAIASDYILNGRGVRLNQSYMKSLDEGYYTYYMTGASATQYAIVNVFQSVGTLSDLKIDYDINYPSVTLTFEGKKGVTYECSIDGSPYTIASSGVILNGYSKSVSHSVTIRDCENHSDSATVTKSGTNSRVASYVNASFTYGGETYDRFIESKEEFDTIIEYIVYVYAPLNRSGRTSLYPGGSASFTFGLSSDFETELNNNQVDYFSQIFAQGGAAYAPSYGATVKNQTATLTINFRTDNPNEIASSQQKISLSNAQKLLKQSSRPNDFDGFKINAFSKTQNIRTIYELENLPFGVKPTFSDNDSLAYLVYEKAKDILRRYVDDSMNDFEKVVAIYDYISMNYTYDDAAAAQAEASDVGKFAAFTSYGTLINGIGVCDGVASAFNILCMIEGIESVEISGRGNGSPHAWNKVKIYGQWYCVDATWSHTATEGGTYYVTHKYLLTDEAANNSYGHVENDLIDNKDLVYVDNAAIGALNYYTIEFLGSGIDYTASSATELYGILSAAKSSGATAVELKWAQSSTPSYATISSVESMLGKRISYYNIRNGVYLFILT